MSSAVMIESHALREGVIHHIRDAIFTGRFTAGSKIDQLGLADELGVSRIPVREALMVLETEGLVENVPRRGTFVAELTAEDVNDHYEILMMVASIIVRRAASSMDDQQLDAMAELLEVAEHASDPRERQAADATFHRIIDEAGASKRVRSFYRSLASGLPSRLYHTSSPRGEAAIAEHREQYEAFRAKDPERAVRAVVRHIESSRDFTLEMLTANGVIATDE